MSSLRLLRQIFSLQESSIERARETNTFMSFSSGRRSTHLVMTRLTAVAQGKVTRTAHGLGRSSWNFTSRLRLTIWASTPMVFKMWVTCSCVGTKLWSRVLSGSSGIPCTLKLISMLRESCALLGVVSKSHFCCPLLYWLRWHNFLTLFLVFSSSLRWSSLPLNQLLLLRCFPFWLSHWVGRSYHLLASQFRMKASRSLLFTHAVQSSIAFCPNSLILLRATGDSPVQAASRCRWRLHATQFKVWSRCGMFFMQVLRERVILTRASCLESCWRGCQSPLVVKRRLWWTESTEKDRLIRWIAYLETSELKSSERTKWPLGATCLSRSWGRIFKWVSQKIGQSEKSN